MYGFRHQLQERTIVISINQDYIDVSYTTNYSG